MKLSTRIKQYATVLEDKDTTEEEIVLFVDIMMGDRQRKFVTTSLKEADDLHKSLTEECGCTFLPKESPVINGGGRIIFHYTTTTYYYWCNHIVKYVAPTCHLIKRESGEVVAATAMFGQGIRYWLYADAPEDVHWYDHYGKRHSFTASNATPKQMNIYEILQRKLKSTVDEWTADGVI